MGVIEHDRNIGMAFADRVEQAVDGRDERALAHRVAVDDVDPELHADEVGRVRRDHPGRERVEMALAREAEALQVDAREASRDGRPHTGRAGRFEAMRDGAAVVDPLAQPGLRQQ